MSPARIASNTSIGSPSGCHSDQAIACARAGLHVLVEKPMAVTTEDATKLVKACDAAGEFKFLYPDDWPFTYVNSVFDFYKTKRFFTFRELRTPAEAVRMLARYAKGYVVWDPAVRTSLIVAYTVAGLEDAVVVSEELIPLVRDAGLTLIEDFRGKFRDMTPAQIYSWAYDRYWARCSKEFIIWLGGDAGPIMKPSPKAAPISPRPLARLVSSVISAI